MAVDPKFENQKSKIKNVVVLSGGMDSTLCATLAVRDFGAEHVAALHVSYGQRTETREQEAFTNICAKLHIDKRLFVRSRHLCTFPERPFSIHRRKLGRSSRCG